MVRLLAKKLGILKINIITSNSKSADYLYQTKYQLLGNKKSKIKTKQNPIHMHYKKKTKHFVSVRSWLLFTSMTI